MRTLSVVMALCIALFIALPSSARQSPRKLGPFLLGQTAEQFRATAAKAGFAKPKLQVPQERDLMGLGLVNVQPITTEARTNRPEPGKIWQVTGYLLSGRVAYLNIDYGLESARRVALWHDRYGAPANARSHLVDGAWSTGGVVLYTDRFGTTLHAVDWGGLHRSGRVAVSLDGAIANANEFFRRLYARSAEASVEQIRLRLVDWFQRRGPDGKLLCTPPPSVGLTPGPTACDLEERRFAVGGEAWRHPTWAALGVNSATLSRFYSYRLETSGSYESARVTLLATGDLDCDGTVATLRVIMSADARASIADCGVGQGQWEVINPFE